MILKLDMYKEYRSWSDSVMVGTDEIKAKEMDGIDGRKG